MYCCAPAEREASKKRGDDPDALPARYARLTNAALEGRPADMTITMHSCRGNFRSTWIAEGGYEFVAAPLLGEVASDGYFLEYDSARAGGFEPLRFVPKGKKQVVLGLVTSKSGALESKDAIRRRIDEAAGMPILRPLIGMDKLEITDQARRLGTFEISIEPDADCCTLFVPKHPATRMSEHEVSAVESRLDIARLVAAGCDGASVEAFEFPS